VSAAEIGGKELRRGTLLKRSDSYFSCARGAERFWVCAGMERRGGHRESEGARVTGRIGAERARDGSDQRERGSPREREMGRIGASVMARGVLVDLALKFAFFLLTKTFSKKGRRFA